MQVHKHKLWYEDLEMTDISEGRMMGRKQFKLLSFSTKWSIISKVKFDMKNEIHLLLNSFRTTADLKLRFKIDRFEIYEVKVHVAQVPSL